MNRLKEVRKKNNLTQVQIADMLSVRQNTYSYWESGKINPDISCLQKLAEYYGVSVDYLLGREFDYDDTDFYQYDGVEPIRRTGRMVPHLGEIACGKPILAEENADEWVELPEGVHADFTLTCRGDSMVGARIYDGDRVFIRRQPMVEDGEIAAVLIGTDATLKRVHRIGNALILMAENPQYPPMMLDVNEGSDVTIMGKAVYFLSAVR